VSLDFPFLIVSAFFNCRYVKNEWAVILVNICVILIIGYSVFIGAVDQTENDVSVCIYLYDL
jgi:uncharacterized membrane protein